MIIHPPNLSDVVLATRYLLAQPDSAQPERCRELIERVQEAARYQEITGRAHARLGDGSIGSYVLRLPLAPMPAQLNEAAFKALSLVLEQFYDTSFISK
ncbi:hypothetical protein [Planktotalea sp.]|uniref:DUF7742 family protein n=1 Tax=Planktotalea sp. TaxID=2029877 RepID=UPI003298990A